MKKYLVVFAKEPKKGKVKTRLKGTYTEEECVGLYKAFLEDVLDIAGRVQADEKILTYQAEGEPVYLKEIATGFKMVEQTGSDLGEKMHNVFNLIGSNKTVIIGSDSPTLPASFIEEAFRGLDDNDIVLGPSEDGGYYLIALKEPCEELFNGIEWSSSRVFDQTIQKAKVLKKKIVLLSKWYDIDAPEDLAKLKHGSGAESTRDFLENRTGKR